MIGENEIKKRLYFLINNPFCVKKEDSSMLISISEKFPYFQIPKILYLKSIKESQKKSENNLKNLTIYATDRTVLFKYISYKNISDLELEVQNFSVLEKKLSFDKWIKISKKTIQRKSENPDLSNHKKLKFSQIDRFVANFPSNYTLKEKTKAKENFYLETDKNLKEKSIQENFFEAEKFKEIITETLAQTYLEQKKYPIALKAYKVLMEKYPKKKHLFVTKIEFIKKNITSNL